MCIVCWVCGTPTIEIANVYVIIVLTQLGGDDAVPDQQTVHPAVQTSNPRYC